MDCAQLLADAILWQNDAYSKDAHVPFAKIIQNFRQNGVLRINKIQMAVQLGTNEMV